MGETTNEGWELEKIKEPHQSLGNKIIRPRAMAQNKVKNMFYYSVKIPSIFTNRLLQQNLLVLQ